MFFQLSHHGTDTVNGLFGVVARQLKEVDYRGGLIVQASDDVVGLGSQLDSRDVFHAYNRTILVLANDHVGEILLRHQTALRTHRVSEFLARRSRLGSHLAGRIHRVLLLNRLYQVGTVTPRLAS